MNWRNCGLKSMFARSAGFAALIIASASLFAGTAQGQVLPTINLDETCKAATGAMVALMGGASSVNDLQICKDSENKARDQIIKDWGTFTASDRAACIQTRGYLPSYVEWLTCFEMNKVVRDAREKQSRAMEPYGSFGGVITLPPVRSLGIMGGR
jgi:hypothetical protein